MNYPRFHRVVCTALLAVLPFAYLAVAQAPKTQAISPSNARDPDTDHEKEATDWFLRGRIIPGKSAAELRHRAYAAKMKMRADRAARTSLMLPDATPASSSSGGWAPLGPVPLASDASGDGFQNYNQVSGRATAVAIDPADLSGNTVYIGGAQGGVWKSTNAASSIANDVTWVALTDDQATLSIGAIAIQPGNTNPANTVIVVGTGEADNSADSYFGLGILVSSDAGNNWTLVSTANGGALSFAGLGATRMAFSTATPNTIVAAMAATNQGVLDGALTSNTYPGLYTSTNAGQSWTYDALSGGGASAATAATSVVYNAVAGLFFAAVRYEGFYSSPDGLSWTRLLNQPGASGLLSTTACPESYVVTCPIYRGEITVVPGRNEMYVWFVSADSNGNPADQGIWQSVNGGASWVEISESGISSCGDFNGCGVDQGFYNLELLALPNGSSATDLYAGAINLYKCSITVVNPACANTPFMNLTHVYGCDPLAALAHVHPDQHALAFTIPTAGSESGADLMYFANDGGIYRALNGFTGLTTGACSGTNQFDDLNQNLGPLTQFVTFSQSLSDANTILAGTQDNGSPATATATTDTSWENVLSGDGGYNAIDPKTDNWFASNPDFPPGSGALNIFNCPSGVGCNDSVFNNNVVINSGSVGGDDGAFYFPYILDSQSNTTLLLGTCRVWGGPRAGGAFTLLSPNFDTLGTGTCTGTEVNTVRALAAGGTTNANGSQVIYATTDGAGPNNLTSPVGGNVWVTTNATAFSGASSTFSNTTLNGPEGNSINPSQFPVSDVAIDTSDSTGDTAYVTVMGFATLPDTTISAGHIWQTTNAGSSWTDFTGSGASALPDSPTNTVAVDPSAHVVYVGTDVGVFESPTSAPAWTEVGPAPSTAGACGFLPNVPVTALALFNSGGQKLLRASTYGRGMWQISLPVTSSSSVFCLAEPGAFPTINVGTTTAQGSITITATSGFSGTVQMGCSTSIDGTCGVAPTSVKSFPTTAMVTVNATGLVAGSYQLLVQGNAGAATNSLTIPVNVADYQLSGPQSINVPAGGNATSNITINPSAFYFGAVNASCSVSGISGAACTVSPNPITVAAGSIVSAGATVTLPGGAVVGPYSMTFTSQDTSGNPSHNLTIPLNVTQGTGSGFQLATTQAFPASVDAGAQATAKVMITSSYRGSVTTTCDASTFAGQCSVTPGNPVAITAGATTPLTITVNVPNSAAPQPSSSYTVNLTVTDSSGAPSQTLPLPLTVIQDFDMGSLTPVTETITVGQSATYNFSVLPVGVSFNNTVSLSCSGAPALCTFAPTSVAPGNNAAAVVLTINTVASSANIYSLPRANTMLYYVLLLTLAG